MTRATPIPVPVKREEKKIIICDGCLNTIALTDDSILPKEWRKVFVPGWIGYFHACQKSCVEKIKTVRCQP